MKKRFSEAVCAACWILAIVVVFAECATAQNDSTVSSLAEWMGRDITPQQLGPHYTVTMRPQKQVRIIKWNNAGFFKDKPKERFFDWRSYPETWDGKQFSLWGLSALSGAFWGARESYHANPYIFEEIYGVGSESFWGSDAWRRNYIDNDPEQPHKHEYLGNVGRDIWHTFGFGSNVLLFSGTFAIGARKQPIKYRVFNGLVGIGVRSLFASLTYNSLRTRAR